MGCSLRLKTDVHNYVLFDANKPPYARERRDMLIHRDTADLVSTAPPLLQSLPPATARHTREGCCLFISVALKNTVGFVEGASVPTVTRQA